MATLATSLGNIGFREEGSGGVPIVFLHGVGSDKSAWDPQLAHFGLSRHSIAFDYPGYGESDPLVERDNAPHDQLADAIFAALDALGVARVHLCGLSLGGVVAIAVAHRAPHRLASLILADSFARHPDGLAILARSLEGSESMHSLARARVPVLIGPNSTSKLASQLIAVMGAIDGAAFRFGSAAVWPVDQRNRALGITVPTLVLCGSDDRVTPPDLSEELAQLIERARLELIPCTCHLPNLENPTAFNAAIAAFLEEIECKPEKRRFPS